MDFPSSRDFLKHPFQQKFRKLNRGDLPSGFYNGQYIEQRWYDSRRIGSIKGFPQW